MTSIQPPNRQSGKDPRIAPYDYKKYQRFPEKRIQTIALIHQNAAAKATQALSSFLEEKVNVTLNNIEQSPYFLYLKSLQAPTCFALIAMHPLSGYGALEVNANIAYAVISKSLGGDCEIPMVAKNFSSLEMAINRKFLNLFLKQLGSAWKELLSLDLSIHEIHTAPQELPGIDRHDPCLVSRFMIDFDNIRGLITFAMPLASFMKVTAQLDSPPWISNEPEISKSEKTIDWRPIEMDVAASLGKLEITGEDLAHLSPGDILRLDKDSSEPIDILITGEAKFKGKPGLTGKYKGIILHNQNGDQSK